MHGKRRRRSPLKNPNEIAQTVVKKGLTKGATEVVKKIGGKVAGAIVGGAGAAAGAAGAAWGLFKGYGNLAKQKHGTQIIKDSGIGTTRKI